MKEMATLAGVLLNTALLTMFVAWPLAIWKLAELVQWVYWWIVQPQGL